MRDMLERLQTISEEQEDYEPEFYGSEYDVNKVTLSQEAVVFEDSSTIDNILSEAHSIRKEISLLHLEVERLSINNERFGTSVRRLTLLKKDSDAIARGIQQHGGAVHARLKALGKESSQLEEKDGPHSAVSRIARTQYDTLTRGFHEVMSDYNKAEEMQRTACRGRIQRQASILGTEINDNQLDVMVDKGGEGWAELSQSLQIPGARTCRMALCELKGRHKELVELEVRMKEVHELFLDMAVLVEDQGYKLNNIEANVCGTQEYIDKINVHIKRALQCKRKNPFQQCCSCWRR
ncbi:syntaxin-11-like [Sebastes umbrosus]|uniref:syntaxin-11-like n=1 Tax=Sebastes umbrosus TaxID=72105 RepID=UPI00189F6256|nr:syntaxin-11-like [Sebastes umbrosus]XP_037605891.1 syntaxin-11-like [Sebastes umbrosus]